jgi:hypothetical protein
VSADLNPALLGLTVVGFNVSYFGLAGLIMHLASGYMPELPAVACGVLVTPAIYWPTVRHAPLAGRWALHNLGRS